MNGQTELIKKVMLNGLKKKIKDAKSEWAKLLNEILWVYRTTTKNSIGETPFRLTYKTKAIIPTEIGCPMSGYYTTLLETTRKDSESLWTF